MAAVATFLEGLFSNYVAAFLPNGDVMLTVLVLWLFLTFYVSRWAWGRTAAARQNGELKGKKGFFSIILIGASLIGLLVGSILLIRSIPPAIAIQSPFSGLTGSQLRQRTLILASDLRSLEASYRKKESELDQVAWIKRRTELPSEKERTASFWQKNFEKQKISEQMKAEYTSRFHVEANQIYEELCRRLKLQPVDALKPVPTEQAGLSQMEYLGIQQMRRGLLAGPSPLETSATALERLSSSL